MKLYGFPISNFYNKVKIILLYKNLPFEEIAVQPGEDPEVIRYSPMGKIPWIADGEQLVFDSTAIAEYLEESYPDPPMLPGSPAERARIRELVALADLHLDPAIRGLHPRTSGEIEPEVRIRMTTRAARTFRLAYDALESRIPDPATRDGSLNLADASLAANLPYLEDLLSSDTTGIFSNLNLATTWPRVAATAGWYAAHPVISRVYKSMKIARRALRMARA